MPFTLAEFLANVKRLLARGHKNRIGTADTYLRTLAKCSGNLCPVDRARYQGEEFAKRLKEAAAVPVYGNDCMPFTSFTKSGLKAKDDGSPGSKLVPLARVEGVYTSTKEDRDRDILEAAGCEVDGQMPVLWQHDPTAPIGAHREILSQDKGRVIGVYEIADTPLGADAAYLAEFGALRHSHGFRPKEFEPITEKDGTHEIVTGFHVTKFEMMEISLVSVPSNTDAVITGLSRGKLKSPVAKSWAGTLEAKRSKYYRTGFGVLALRPVKAGSAATVVGIKRVPVTGVKRKPKPRKDAAETEKALAEACAKIVHSGDYGLCFYRPAQDEAMVEVWWTAADSDTPDNADESGQPFTSADEVKALLGAINGVAAVQVEAEANPPFGEGWRQVYPDVRDWNDEQSAQQTQEPASDATAPAAADDATGKGKKPAGKKGDGGTPVVGSFEHVAERVAGMASEYLGKNGVEIPEGYTVSVEATYPDSVILCVGMGEPGEQTDKRFYQVSYSADDAGKVTLTGAPVLVELQTVVADSGTAPAASEPVAGDAAAAPAAGDNAADKGKKPVRKWLPVKTKGKLTKKDTSLLNEAREHLDDAMSRDGMPTVCKTLVRRASDLINDVCKSDGTDADAPADQLTEGAGEMGAGERSLWKLCQKAMNDRTASNTAKAALLSELATQLEAGDVARLLGSLS